MLALMEWTWIKDISHLLCCLLLVAEHEGLAAGPGPHLLVRLVMQQKDGAKKVKPLEALGTKEAKEKRNGTNSAARVCNVGDLGSIRGLGRSPGGGHGNPL